MIGSFLLFLEWYTFPAYTLRDNPKSATLTSLPSQTRTFLAARSRWTNPFFERNSYARKEKKFWPLQRRLLRDRAAGFRVCVCGGGGGGGAKEECMKEIWGGAGGHACGNLFNFSKVSDGECYYNDKTIDFFHIFSDIAIGSEN